MIFTITISMVITRPRLSGGISLWGQIPNTKNTRKLKVEEKRNKIRNRKLIYAPTVCCFNVGHCLRRWLNHKYIIDVLAHELFLRQ